MRKLHALVFCLLAIAMLAASGCCCLPCGGTATGENPADGPGGPSIYPGVVEVYRNNGDTLVGYVSTDAGSSVSYWLLSSPETPVVMPNTLGSPGNRVVWNLISTSPMNAQDLCKNYGGNLTNPRLFTVTNGPPSLCH